LLLYVHSLLVFSSSWYFKTPSLTDHDIFTGIPSLKHLVHTYNPKLNAKEQAYIDHEVTRLCGLLNDHNFSMKKDFNKEVWDYMREEGFFALKMQNRFLYPC
jgi:acyl-CoA dehydrogenase